jgi:hypothetical protein
MFPNDFLQHARLGQLRRNRARIGVQIEEDPDLRCDWLRGVYRNEAIFARMLPHCDRGAMIAVFFDALQPGNRPRPQETQKRGPVVRRLVLERQLNACGRRVHNQSMPLPSASCLVSRLLPSAFCLLLPALRNQLAASCFLLPPASALK